MPVLVVVLLDDCGDDPRHADAVAAHHHRVLDARLVGVGGVERLGVLGAELEHVADLDAAVDRQRRPAAGHGSPVTTLTRSAQWSTVKSRPSTAWRTWWSISFAPVTHGRRLADERIGDDERRAGEVGADVALRQLGVGGEVVVVVQAHRRGATAGEREGVDLPVAGHERETELAVEVERDALQQLDGVDTRCSATPAIPGRSGVCTRSVRGRVDRRRLGVQLGCAARAASTLAA